MRRVVKGSFVYVNEVSLGKTLEDGVAGGPNHVLKGLRTGDHAQSPRVNDLISHTWVLKPPQKPKRKAFRELLRRWGAGGAGRREGSKSLAALCPFPLSQSCLSPTYGSS